VTQTIAGLQNTVHNAESNALCFSKSEDFVLCNVRLSTTAYLHVLLTLLLLLLELLALLLVLSKLCSH